MQSLKKDSFDICLKCISIVMFLHVYKYPMLYTIYIYIQFNSSFHFTQCNTIYTDFQIIYVINKLYTNNLFDFSHTMIQ